MLLYDSTPDDYVTSMGLDELKQTLGSIPSIQKFVYLDARLRPVKKSTETKSWTWLFKKTPQVREGGFRFLGISRETVRSEIQVVDSEMRHYDREK